MGDDMAKSKSKNPLTWAKLNTYRDKGGRELHEFEGLFGEDRGKKFYCGAVVVTVRFADPRMPPQKQRYEFKFEDGTTLKQAFDTFDEVCEEEMKKEEDKQRVVAANAMPNIPIMGPDGKPPKGRNDDREGTDLHDALDAQGQAQCDNEHHQGCREGAEDTSRMRQGAWQLGQD